MRLLHDLFIISVVVAVFMLGCTMSDRTKGTLLNLAECLEEPLGGVLDSAVQIIKDPSYQNNDARFSAAVDNFKSSYGEKAISYLVCAASRVFSDVVHASPVYGVENRAEVEQRTETRHRARLILDKYKVVPTGN